MIKYIVTILVLLGVIAGTIYVEESRITKLVEKKTELTDRNMLLVQDNEHKAAMLDNQQHITAVDSSVRADIAVTNEKKATTVAVINDKTVRRVREIEKSYGSQLTEDQIVKMSDEISNTNIQGLWEVYCALDDTASQCNTNKGVENVSKPSSNK